MLRDERISTKYLILNRLDTKQENVETVLMLSYTLTIGDSMSERRCPKCKIAKADSEFYEKKPKTCRQCYRECRRRPAPDKELKWKRWLEIPLHKCSLCKEMKQGIEFHHGNRYHCKPCSIQYQVDWTRKQDGTQRQRHVAKERIKRQQEPEKWRDYWQEKKYANYGVSKAWFDERLVDQGGVCAICGCGETGRHQSGHLFPLCIDHNHATGKVRGLLCRLCNNHLHSVEKKPDWPRLAVAYLERYK